MLHTLIMAGGQGTRFWPASRRSRPKHLLRLVGDKTLLEEACERLRGAVRPEAIWIVTTAEQADAVREAVPDLPADNIIVEPCGRDTAAALGLGAARIAAADPEAVLCAMPADHLIRPAKRFREAVDAAARILARRPDAVVTLGIRPTEPATGYGYIRRGRPLGEAARDPAERDAVARLAVRAFEVEAFVEKPDRATAEGYLDSGAYFWNAGIFVWRARALLDAIERFLPATRPALDLAGDALAEAYAGLHKISIDFAVLEKHEQVIVCEADFQWSDVGSWTALPEVLGEDAEGSTVAGGGMLQAVDSANLIVCGEGVFGAVGVSDLVIVRAGEAVLVCARDRAQDVKALVDALKARGLDDVL